MVVGPIGRGLANGITAVLVWMTENLGVVGYSVFSAVQQLIVITGLHHVFGTIESQLLVDTGRNFLNPLMSVAMTAQGGAVGGAVVYFTDLAALGFGTTVVPGIALADPAHNGYLNYIIAHVIALAAGFLFALLLGIFFNRRKSSEAVNGNSISTDSRDTAGQQAQIYGKESGTDHAGNADGKKAEVPEEIAAFTSGKFIGIEKVNDPTFAQKMLGDGVAIVPAEGKICAPADCTVEMVMDTKHAVGLRTAAGNGLLSMPDLHRTCGGKPC
nr:PTS glucose transporter subunit IIA [Mediterraneibacter glycyrrhizinilyticus]